jgi:hypothetical protein
MKIAAPVAVCKPLNSHVLFEVFFPKPDPVLEKSKKRPKKKRLKKERREEGQREKKRKKKHAGSPRETPQEPTKDTELPAPDVPEKKLRFWARWGLRLWHLLCRSFEDGTPWDSWGM